MISSFFHIHDDDLILLGDVFLEKKGKINLPGNIVFNHEFVISNDDDPKYPYKVNLVSRDNYISDTFPYANKIYANLSNNHTMDFGEDAFNRTVKILEIHNIDCFGHCTKNQASKIYKAKGIEFSLLGFNMEVPSIGQLTTEPKDIIPLIKKDIEVAKKSGSKRIVVSIHFGAKEHQPQNYEKQKIVARTAIDIGADIVVGHHTHCIQNIEIYKNKYIFYGLGNTWFLNLRTPAFYDESGKEHAIYRARETKWSTDSLVVAYSLVNESVKIYKASCRKGKFKLIKKVNVSEINNYIHKFPKCTGFIRRILLFLISNTFCDGKIIDVNAFKFKFYEKKLKQKKIARHWSIYENV